MSHPNRILAASLLVVTRFAQAETPIGPQGGLSPFIPMIVIFGIIYFLILRPQQKKMKLQQQFLTELKKGDMVITNAGIIGTIRTLSEKFVTLEVDEGVCLKIVRSQILESANVLKDDPKKA